MRVRLIAATLSLCLSASAAMAAVVIRDDLGGPLGDYLLRFGRVRDSGERVVIDGRCYSACTIVTGLVPAERICVTPRAKLGFHAARGPDEAGRLVINRAATQTMMSLYPPPIKAWLRRHGGLNGNALILSGAALAKFYSACR